MVPWFTQRIWSMTTRTNRGITNACDRRQYEFDLDGQHVLMIVGTSKESIGQIFVAGNAMRTLFGTAAIGFVVLVVGRNQHKGQAMNGKSKLIRGNGLEMRKSRRLFDGFLNQTATTKACFQFVCVFVSNNNKTRKRRKTNGVVAHMREKSMGLSTTQSNSVSLLCFVASLIAHARTYSPSHVAIR